MRYTKFALLLFGLGMIAGLVVVAGDFAAWERPAAALMAVALLLIPIGLFADGRGWALLAWLTARLSRRRPPPKRGKPRAAAVRRKKPARLPGRPRRSGARTRSR